MFDLDLVNSTITIFYIKMAIVDFFIYLGALFGLYKNYAASMAVYKQQLATLELTEAQQKESLKIARYKYIRDNAKTHYMKVRAMAEATDNKVDDKLLAYVESFYTSMVLTFGTPPTKEEIKQMADKAEEIHEQVKLIESKKDQ